MGRRISYFKNPQGKNLKDLILENFDAFRQWYLETEKSSLEEFNEDFGSENLKNYFRLATDLKKDFDLLDKKLVDELTAEFIGTYCDMTDSNGEILTFFGPCMSTWRYEGSNELVLKTENRDFIMLWSYLVSGRSLKDSTDFSKTQDNYGIGFLTFEEHRRLKSHIENHFGDLEKIKETYWTSQEKKELERALASRSYGLTNHNPKSSGLEYVLVALNQLQDSRSDLITGIE